MQNGQGNWIARHFASQGSRVREVAEYSGRAKSSQQRDALIGAMWEGIRHAYSLTPDAFVAVGAPEPHDLAVQIVDQMLSGGRR